MNNFWRAFLRSFVFIETLVMKLAGSVAWDIALDDLANLALLNLQIGENQRRKNLVMLF